MYPFVTQTDYRLWHEAANPGSAIRSLSGLNRAWPGHRQTVENDPIPDISRQQSRPQLQRYILLMSTDDSTPSLTKFFASQSPAHFRPWSRRKMRKSQSALYLLVELSAPMNSSSEMLWISTCGSSSPTMRFSVTSFVTKLTARISRIRDELKLISLMRFKMSPAARGTSLRNSE